MSPTLSDHPSPRFAAIAIGRNEGERLKHCLLSLSRAALVIYVDSGSTDGSIEWAKELGLGVVELDTSASFTAARARNAGFSRLRKTAPGIEYVQFLDGDCELNQEWPSHAIAFLRANEDACAAFGRRRERFPDRSIYNHLCDLEWNVPIGEARACGGDVMIRALALDAVGGYREDMIAGEEPELCVRWRAAGWHIWRLDFEMTLHDAAMTRFGQWWLRNVRSGYAFAQGAHLHGAPPERHWVWESRRALIWGLWLPIACIMAGAIFGPWGNAAWLVYPLQMLRLMLRNQGSVRERTMLAIFQTLARFPEALGQIKFKMHQAMRRRARLIEYK
jgi:glycosyltransferase involved in cell wall biosynthesis